MTTDFGGKTPKKLTGLIESLGDRVKPSSSRLPRLDFSKDEHATAEGFQEIDIDLIDPSPLPPRVVYTEQALKKLEASLREHGQQEAIHVRPNRDVPGRFIIVDGQSRLTVFRRGQISQTIRAENHEDMDDVAAFWFGFHQNSDRAQPTDLDLGMAFDLLLKLGKATDLADLADQSGMAEATVSAYMAFAGLPEDLRETIRKSDNPDKITYNVAGMIRSLLNKGIDDEHALRFATVILEGDLTQKEIVRLKKQIENDVIGHRRIKKGGAQAFASFSQYGHLNTKKDGLELKLTGLAPEMVAQIADAVRVIVDQNLPTQNQK